MMIDSGASHILVRQEHANILSNITMFGPNAEPVMHLQTAKKGSTLHAIGQGLLYIGNFHLRAYIFKNDELNTSLLGLNPLTAQGCSATFTHDSFNLHHGPDPVPILSGYKHTTQDTWQVRINQIESFTPNDQKAWNLQSLDIASFYITTPLSQTLGKQRVSVPRKQRVSAKLRKNTYELSTHAESTSLHMAEIHRILDIMTRSPISAPVKYYVKQLDFRSERLYHMTRGLHIAPDSDIQMETTISSEPSQSNLDEYPRVTDEFVINYTPQMDLNNIFTKTLPELQYDELLQCVSIDSQENKTS